MLHAYTSTQIYTHSLARTVPHTHAYTTFGKRRKLSPNREKNTSWRSCLSYTISQIMSPALPHTAVSMNKFLFYVHGFFATHVLLIIKDGKRKRHTHKLHDIHKFTTKSALLQQHKHTHTHRYEMLFADNGSHKKSKNGKRKKIPYIFTSSQPKIPLHQQLSQTTYI